MAYEGAILWDVDGTLLTASQGGRLALRQATVELVGVELDYGDLVTSGLTDSAVHEVALRNAGIDPDPGLVARVSAEYVRRLPHALPLHEGGVLPGVVETLENLEAGGRVVNLLLTGNTVGGAFAKLDHYELGRFFPHGGGFCDGDKERAPIAHRALALALSLIDGTVDNVVVVGDTPHDVACARETGLRAVGVATGLHTVGDLVAAGAWRVYDRVPDALELERVVLDGAAAA